ncbi:hypothetical protein EPI10_000589 [Gossypium australe]|uniref:Uncharacterized protein n=1 Tax=Gossypium australe TaxID=47621 RepID=A0A5B6V902_9ROSI|nr:hypothetical protein EPI10_000589 [Gossypium australe]
MLASNQFNLYYQQWIRMGPFQSSQFGLYIGDWMLPGRIWLIYDVAPQPLILKVKDPVDKGSRSLETNQNT